MSSFGGVTCVALQEGRMALRRVLCAVAAAVPSVGYCQGINFIAGQAFNLLLLLPPPHLGVRCPSSRILLR